MVRAFKFFFNINTQMESCSLLETVSTHFLEQNKTWIQKLFTSLPVCVTELIPNRTEHEFGHQYKFSKGCFNTRIGIMASCKVSGPKCGDNGGLTQKKEFCKRNAVLHGRCALHPMSVGQEVYQQNEYFAEVIVTFGIESNMRPLPFTTTFRNLNIIVRDQTLHALDILDDSLVLTPAFVVWNQVIDKIKIAAQIPRELSLVVNSQPGFAAEPWWLVDHFCSIHNLKGVLQCNNTPTQAGFTLKDYDLNGVWTCV